jgi:hypothetical protein
VNCSGLTEGGGRDEENVLEKDEIEESVWKSMKDVP